MLKLRWALWAAPLALHAAAAGPSPESKRHWDIYLDIRVPDSLKTPDFRGELRLWEDLISFGPEGLRKVFFGHFECDYDVHIGAKGRYLVRDSAFMQKLECQFDTIRGTLNFLTPGPRVQAPDSVNLYQFQDTTLRATAQALPGRPIRRFHWESFQFNPFTIALSGADSSTATLFSPDTGNYRLWVSAEDDFGRTASEPLPIRVIPQPEVFNRMRWDVTLEDDPGGCKDMRVTFLEGYYQVPIQRLDLRCGSFDTLFYGRAEGKRVVRLDMPGYYFHEDTLCNLCSCDFRGFDRNPAQEMDCQVSMRPGPTADLGPDFHMVVGDLAFLRGGNSRPASPDKPIVKYEWGCDALRSTAPCRFFDPTAESSVPFVPGDTGLLYFNLRVHDAEGASALDEIVVQVLPPGGNAVRPAARPGGFSAAYDPRGWLDLNFSEAAAWKSARVYRLDGALAAKAEGPGRALRLHLPAREAGVYLLRLRIGDRVYREKIAAGMR